MDVPIAHRSHHFGAEPHGIGLQTYLLVAWVILKKIGVHALVCLKRGHLSIQTLRHGLLQAKSAVEGDKPVFSFQVTLLYKRNIYK